MSNKQNDQFEEYLTDSVRDWKDSLQLANAFYSLYKTYRSRTDGLESTVRALVERSPLSEQDWQHLRKVVENG